MGPGDVVAIVGAGPIGLAAALIARLLTPSLIISIDVADSRLARAGEFGADIMINKCSKAPRPPSRRRRSAPR